MDIKDFSVKAVKTFRSHDGGGFACNLYMKTKKVAEVVDDGWGGGLQFHWLDFKCPKVQITKKDNEETFSYNGTPNEKILVELINDLPPIEDYGMVMSQDLDTFVGDLVNNHLQEKEFKRKCKNKTLVITKDLRDGEYSVYSRPYSPEMKTWLEKSLGDNLVKIINEDYL